ncbi:glycosyltransferase family 2 protein [Candidatus Woesearchaeota archaeon]|nr:glycosyltransferase family 2 protein [Candidatus Woesearchaeota archaeon]
MSGPKISVVFPVYNEEGIIERTIRSYYDELKGRIDFEMIVAEDGSTDKTKSILKRLKRELPIRAYMSDARKGYQKAVIDSLKHPRHGWIFLVDSDYQFEPRDFWKLLPYAGQYDIVLGRKVNRKDPLHRIILSKGFNFLLRLLFNVPYRDMDTGYRLINRKALDAVVNDIHCLKYFTSELVIRAHYQGFRIKEVPVMHFKRKKGSTNVFPIRRIPSVVMEELVGLLKLRMDHKLKK